MSEDQATPKQSVTPIYNRPGVLKAVIAIIAVAFLWAVFSESDDDEWDDMEEAAFLMQQGQMPGVGANATGGFPMDAPMSDYQDDYDDLEDESVGGYPNQGGYPDQGGYYDDGGFRGQAEVGGSPIVSGTIDNSGEGNHVFSVDGKVLELP